MRSSRGSRIYQKSQWLDCTASCRRTIIRAGEQWRVSQAKELAAKCRKPTGHPPRCRKPSRLRCALVSFWPLANAAWSHLAFLALCVPACLAVWVSRVFARCLFCAQAFFCVIVCLHVGTGLLSVNGSSAGKAVVGWASPWWLPCRTRSCNATLLWHPLCSLLTGRSPPPGGALAACRLLGLVAPC